MLRITLTNLKLLGATYHFTTLPGNTRNEQTLKELAMNKIFNEVILLHLTFICFVMQMSLVNQYEE